MVDLAASVTASSRPSHAVVGVPGRVDYERGRLEWGRNQPAEWRTVLQEASLCELVGLPVSLANDADLAAVGEAWFGSAARRDMAYLTISSGVGAGAVVGGRLVRGRAKLLEVGLTILGLPDDASEPVLLEDLASGSGLRTAAQRVGIDADAEAIAGAVRTGDRTAIRLWERYSRAVAATAVNLAHLLLPEVIVIGGGVGRSGQLILDPVRQWLERYGPRQLPVPIAVVEAALGDDAGLIGAAAWSEALGQGEDGLPTGQLDAARG